MFKHVCKTNNTHEETALWIHSHNAEESLVNTLKSCMCTKDCLTSFAADVRKKAPIIRELLRSYGEVVKGLSKNNATVQVTTYNGGAILRYVQPPNGCPQQYADNLITKSCKVADFHEEVTLNDIFIKVDDSSIWNSLRNYFVTNPQAHLTDIAFQAKSLMSIQNGFGNTLTNNLLRDNSAKSYPCTPSNSRNVLSNTNMETMSTSTQKSRRRPTSTLALKINALSTPSMEQSSAQSFSSWMRSTMLFLCGVHYDTFTLFRNVRSCIRIRLYSYRRSIQATCRNREAENYKSAQISPAPTKVADS